MLDFLGDLAHGHETLYRTVYRTDADGNEVQEEEEVRAGESDLGQVPAEEDKLIVTVDEFLRGYTGYLDKRHMPKDTPRDAKAVGIQLATQPGCTNLKTQHNPHCKASVRHWKLDLAAIRAKFPQEATDDEDAPPEDAERPDPEGDAARFFGGRA